MGTIEWGADLAAAYDTVYRAMAAPEVVDPMVDLLAALAGAGTGAGGGPVLELAIGNGRLALPLRARGVEVHGIELSAAMVAQLRQKPGGEDLPVVVGDMTSASPPGGPYALVFIVANSLMNVTTQAEQVATVRNAAAHLAPGGVFVVELAVPQVQQQPRVFRTDPDHVSIETFDDPVGQVAWSHHWMVVDGQPLHHAAPYRYVWPAELDLMAELAGLRLEARWADWLQSGFTSASERQVAVYRS